MPQKKAIRKWKVAGKTRVKVASGNTEKLKELRGRAFLEATYFDARGTKVAEQFVLLPEANNNEEDGKK